MEFHKPSGLKSFCKAGILLLTTGFILNRCTGSARKHTEPIHQNKDANHAEVKLNRSYTNPAYDVSLRLPEEWILLEEPNLKVGKFAINMFKRNTGAEDETPLGVHTDPGHSYVAIWPYGVGTDLPPGRLVSFTARDDNPDLTFPVNKQKSKVLLLKSGSPWAYFIIPQNPPETWGEYGFIFAQIRTTNTNISCYDEKADRQKPSANCDSANGDQYIREGNINARDAETVHNILETISLKKVEEKQKASDMIHVEKPRSNMDVTSPLTVKGKARGSWYFEGTFSLTLKDAKGNILAEAPVKAEGKWMTRNFVPFQTRITFDAPDDERGWLIFHKANPSGLSKHDRSYAIRVIFPPK